jgi:hypothetical protein
MIERAGKLARLSFKAHPHISTHPILGDELRALRRLQREQEPKSPFAFTTPDRGGGRTADQGHPGQPLWPPGRDHGPCSAYRHGLRAAELVDLRWEQVDFRTATLHVRRVKQGTPSAPVCANPCWEAASESNCSIYGVVGVTSRRRTLAICFGLLPLKTVRIMGLVRPDRQARSTA